MSSIPPNIAAALIQAQYAAGDAARTADAQRNKHARDARALARLADRQQHEVENADQAEHTRVHRDGDQQRNPNQDPPDTFQPHDPDSDNSESPTTTPDQTTPPVPSIDPDNPPPHIDLNA